MPHNPPHLYLVDGYALLYRAFFAMISRPLRTSRGENSSAAWGVVNFLIRLLEKYRPDYIVWVHDMGSSFRAERYPDYKSTREKLDAELQADFDRSVERTGELLAAFGIPLIGVPGYEADDVIGTLAEQATGQGLQSVIVSGDKDFYQLIGERVALLNPGRGGPAGVDEMWVGPENASERLGVPPSQVCDYLALVGDSSDNVPGVKGIGAKGAVQLLTEHGDLETLLARAADIKGKRAREALLSSADVARLSRELVTIQRNVPVELDLVAMRASEPDRARLVSILTELEFYSLVRRFDDGAAGGSAPSTSIDAAPGAEAPTRNVNIITDVADIAALVTRLRAAPLVSLDTETSSLQPRDAELIGLSLAASKDDVWYLPFGHRAPAADLLTGSDVPEPVVNLPPITDPALLPLRQLLEAEDVPKAGHNIKYDWQVLRRAGVELCGVAFDSMLASFVLEPGRRSHAIDTIVLEQFGTAMTTYRDLCGKGKTEIAFAEVPVKDAANYCCADSALVLALHEVFAPQLDGTGMRRLLDEVEMPLVAVLADMEWDGIGIDGALFRQLADELGSDLAQLESTIGALAGSEVNLNSPRQLAQVLFEQQGLPVLKKTKTGPSTDADVLDQLAAMGHELPRLILEYRELQKLKSTYVDTLPLSVNRATGRIHTSFNQTGAATGRLSSSDPNLQNIPVRTARGEAIRRGFVPSAGAVFLVADYSQIELRLMAHLSADPAFVDAFRAGGDIHRQTASLIFGVPLEEVSSEMRGRAKTINFATIYGQGAFSLSKQLGIAQEEAKEFIADYFARFHGVRGYLDRQVALARDQGFVETIFGRRRYIPEIKDRNFNMRSYGERLAQNSPLQGSAADLIKVAMIGIHRAIQERALASRMLLQVHDELVFEVPLAEVDEMGTLVKERMESAAELAVPLVVDIGTGGNWLEAKS